MSDKSRLNKKEFGFFLLAEGAKISGFLVLLVAALSNPNLRVQGGHSQYQKWGEEYVGAVS